MPRKSTSYRDFDIFQKKLEQYINKNIKDMISGLPDEVGETFVKRAQDRLDRFADSESMDGNSASIVKSLKDNITYTKGSEDESSSQGYIEIKDDSQHLMMFLEYGTGIAGSYNEHPEARKSGWLYAVNPTHYKRVKGLKYNGYGWFFNKSADSFIGKDDITNMVISHKTFQEVKGYIRKNGSYVKPYVRQIKTKPDRIVDKAVLTQGIKPVRFIYDTKKEILNFLKDNKGKTLGAFKRNLSKLRNK